MSSDAYSIQVLKPIAVRVKGGCDEPVQLLHGNIRDIAGRTKQGLARTYFERNRIKVPTTSQEFNDCMRALFREAVIVADALKEDRDLLTRLYDDEGEGAACERCFHIVATTGVVSLFHRDPTNPNQAPTAEFAIDKDVREAQREFYDLQYREEFFTDCENDRSKQVACRIQLESPIHSFFEYPAELLERTVQAKKASDPSCLPGKVSAFFHTYSFNVSFRVKDKKEARSTPPAKRGRRKN